MLWRKYLKAQHLLYYLNQLHVYDRHPKWDTDDEICLISAADFHCYDMLILMFVLFFKLCPIDYTANSFGTRLCP